jgi:hypothetical protein
MFIWRYWLDPAAWLDCRRFGVQIQTGSRDSLSHCSVQTCCWAHSPSQLTGIGGCSSNNKEIEAWSLTILFHLMPMLMSGAVPPVHHTSSWRRSWLSTGTTLSPLLKDVYEANTSVIMKFGKSPTFRRNLSEIHRFRTQKTVPFDVSHATKCDLNVN